MPQKTILTPTGQKLPAHFMDRMTVSPRSYASWDEQSRKASHWLHGDMVRGKDGRVHLKVREISRVAWVNERYRGEVRAADRWNSGVTPAPVCCRALETPKTGVKMMRPRVPHKRSLANIIYGDAVVVLICGITLFFIFRRLKQINWGRKNA